MTAQDYWVKPGKNGIFIKFGKELPKGFEYRLERKPAEGTSWKTIKTFIVPQSKEEVKSRMMLAVSKNPFYGMPGDGVIAHFYGRIKASSISDSLYFYASNPLFIQCSGAGYFDTDALPGVKYEYRITKVHNNLEMSRPVTLKADVFPAVSPNYAYKFSSVEASGNSIHLSWSFTKNKYPFGVRVFKEVYMQTTRQEIFPAISFIEQGDSIFASFTDKEVAERITYRYTVIPFDAFGNEMPPSDAVIVLNVKPFGEAIQLLKFTATSREKENAIRLSWKYKSMKAMNGITIYRSENFDNGFVELTHIPASDTSFMDYNVQPVKNYYYFMVFDNIYGQSPPTIKVIGMLKPNHKSKLAPQQVKVTQVPEGNKISWLRTEPDTKGYYVFRGNGYKSQLVQLTDIIESDSIYNSYIDKTGNLMVGINHSYVVRSINTSSSISPMSDTVYAQPLRKEIPVPLNLRIIPYNDKIMLVWEDMHAISTDVLGYRIYRWETTPEGKKITEPKIICKQIELNNYFDSIKQDVHYNYYITSLGVMNTESNKSISVEYFKPFPKPIAPGGIRAIAMSNSILIHWDEPAVNDIKEYRLYREIIGSQPKMITVFKPGTTDYADNAVEIGKSYFYRISSVNLKGVESEKSDEVGISIKSYNTEPTK